MLHEIIIAGFGGQGVMSMGTLLAYAGIHEGKKVTWMPSYGPEQRGGTANCHVVISDQEIGSPVITHPTALVVMNQPSLDKFEGSVRQGGILIINRSLVNSAPRRHDVRIAEVPAYQLAMELGTTRVANMVILGVLVGLTGAVSLETVVESLKKVLPERRYDLIPLNRKALEAGLAWASSQ